LQLNVATEHTTGTLQVHQDSREVDAEVPDHKRVSFSLGYFYLTPRVLPFALRASFAVHTRTCAYVDKQKRSTSPSQGGLKPLL